MLARFGLSDRIRAGAALGGFVFPRVHPFPHTQGAGLVRAGIERGVSGRCGEAAHDGLRPGPVRPRCDPHARKHHTIRCTKAAELGEKRAGDGAEVGGKIVGTGGVFGFFQPHHAGQ